MNTIPHIVPTSELRCDEYQLMQRKLEIAELLAAGEADIQTGKLTSSKEVHAVAKFFLDEKRAKKADFSDIAKVQY